MQSSSKSGIVILAFFSALLLSCVRKTPTIGETETVLEWQTIFFDDFNRSDGPIGSNYSVTLYIPSVAITDTLSIKNNNVRLSGELYYAVKYANEVTNDIIRVSVKFITTAAPTGNYAFGVCARGTYEAAPDYQLAEAYGGFVEMDTDSIGITKFSGENLNLPVPLVSKAYDVQENRSYLLELTVANKNITFVVKDLITAIVDTLTFEDNDLFLSGGTVSINGMLGEAEVIYFDDFKIERYE